MLIHTFATIAAALLISPAALAAPTVELSITGLIIPGACTPTLSNGGLVDYGKISRQALNADKRTQLQDRTLDFSIHCTTPKQFALRMRDNKDGSAIVNSEIYYGLNFDRSGNKIGLYSLHFHPLNTVVDTLPQVFRTDSTTEGRAWSASSSSSIPIGARSYLGFTDIAGSTAGPIEIQNLNSRVTVETVIAPTSTLDLSSDVTLDGSATLELLYL
ncbi:DUF1120 domain-containing protein [Pseudomonas sp. PDM32]|jgi:hypothetical protein|uniref:DUF1120 domain-containing protein n=1 Tax=Pseudomonas sp. PDM32 TaxID=2854768 RepID=UPI001C46FE5D|nr:DUF1120 domain-containing protein [Pseudomonas sp. PDM32]MBV7572907.1 DUF1120 domain-containing protein [Pseudomonas sp. PDM32]